MTRLSIITRHVEHKYKSDLKGIKVGGIYNIKYAHDTVMIADCRYIRQSGLNVVVMEIYEKGFSVKVKKTECRPMVAPKKNTLPCLYTTQQGAYD